MNSSENISNKSKKMLCVTQKLRMFTLKNFLLQLLSSTTPLSSVAPSSRVKGSAHILNRRIGLISLHLATCTPQLARWGGICVCSRNDVALLPQMYIYYINSCSTITTDVVNIHQWLLLTEVHVSQTDCYISTTADYKYKITICNSFLLQL